MGTRSLTVLKDDEGDEIVVMYRQYDGYPEGHGQELVEFLRKADYNGMECLAAQVIAHFKNEHGRGGIYLHPAGTRNCGEEWIYTIYQKEGKVMMKVQAGCVTFFGMPGTKQENMPVFFDDRPSNFDHEACYKSYAEKLKKNAIPNDYLNEKGLGVEQSTQA